MIVNPCKSRITAVVQHNILNAFIHITASNTLSKMQSSSNKFTRHSVRQTSPSGFDFLLCEVLHSLSSKAVLVDFKATRIMRLLNIKSINDVHVYSLKYNSFIYLFTIKYTTLCGNVQVMPRFLQNANNFNKTAENVSCMVYKPI